MLTTLPQVGQKVRFISHNPGFRDLTIGKEYEIVRIDRDGDAKFIDDADEESYIAESSFFGYELVVNKTLTELPRVGQVVRYIGDDEDYLTTGEEYAVVDIDEDGDAVIIDDDGDEDWIYRGNFTEFELVEEEKEIVAPFAVGDKVRMVNTRLVRGSGYTTEGETYDVVEVTITGAIAIDDTSDERLLIFPSEFAGIEKVEAPKEVGAKEGDIFNVGDKIRILDVDAIEYGSECFDTGDIVEVVRIESFLQRPYLRGPKSNDEIYVMGSELHAIQNLGQADEEGDEQVAKLDGTFNVEDKVELLDKKGALAGFNVGDICTVLNTNSGGVYQYGICNEVSIGFTDASSLRLVTEEAPKPLTKLPKAGDVVRATRADGVSGIITRGKEYTILGETAQGNVYFEGDDGISTMPGATIIKPWFMDEFDLVSEAPVANAQPTEAPCCDLEPSLEARVDALEARLAAIETGNVDVAPGTLDITSSGFRITTGVAKTSNELRKETIEKAKAFVAEIQAEVQGLHDERDDANYIYNDLVTVTEFTVDEAKRTVSVVALGANYPEKYGEAVAKCNPEDVFNVYIGKAIAIGRLYGLDVTGFEMAAQPTEVVAGMVVRNTGWAGGTYPIIEVRENEFSEYKMLQITPSSHFTEDYAEIKEDTDAKY